MSKTMCIGGEMCIGVYWGVLGCIGGEICV